MADDPIALLQAHRSSLALRSTAAVLFAIACFWPPLSAATLIKLFAAYAFVDGVLTVSFGGWDSSRRLVWPLMVGGCADLVAAATAYAWSGMSLAGLINVLMLWGIALAVTFTAACATLGRADRDYLLLLCGIASGLFARALLSYTAADVVVISTWTGLYGLTVGILFLNSHCSSISWLCWIYRQSERQIRQSRPRLRPWFP
jgi:uncharacterized membrane protein HdeD (DUF308 family)